MNGNPKNKSSYISRFLKPILNQKAIAFRYLIQAIMRGIGPIVHLVFIQKLTNTLTTGTVDQFYTWIGIYLGTYITYETLWFLTKKWGWVELLSATKSELYDTYLHKYIRADISYSEKIGTKKAIAIIQKGIQTWAQLLSDLFERGIALLVIILYALYILYQKGWVFVVSFLVILITGIVFASYVNNRQFVKRAARRDALNYVTHMLVKILMSKNEILETDNIITEVDKIKATQNEIKTINQDMSLGRVLTHRLLNFLIGLGIIAIMYIYGSEVINGTMELGVLVGVTGTFVLIQNNLKNFMGFYVQFTKSFIDIEKLFEFFDDAPTLQGYEGGEDFIFRQGHIEVKNINFSYSKEELVFNDFSMEIKPGKK